MKTISSVLVLFILSVAHIECILQGDKISISNHPYIVSIRDITNHHLGGGAIISPRLILTSTRVLDDVDPQFLAIVAGTDSLVNGGKVFGVENYAKHKDGIALLRTSNEITFVNSIQPIRIPTTDSYPINDAVVAGWGKVRNVSIIFKYFHHF